MAGGAAVVLAVLGVLAAVHSQQETRFEDPTTEFYTRLLRTLIANSSQSLLGALTRMEDSAAKETTLMELQDSLRDVKDSISNLERGFKNVRNSMDNGVDRTRVEMRMFRDKVSQELADLRRLVEDKTKDRSKQVLGTCTNCPIIRMTLVFLRHSFIWTNHQCPLITYFLFLDLMGLI